MDCTPLHLDRSLLRLVQTSVSGRDLIHVRKLYLERRYKQCLALCDDLFELELHRVHGSFLRFHQAICYEALGLAAHNYSRNKILFLESARAKFADALSFLPQLFTVDETGHHDTPKTSPMATEFSSTEIHSSPCEPFPDLVVTPLVNMSNRTRTPSDASSHYSTSTTSSISEPYTVPDFDDYHPRPDHLAIPQSLPRTVTFADIQKQEEIWNQASESSCPEQPSALTPHKSRLSACLSSTHVLANDLVPSPLFSRRKKIAHIEFPRAFPSNLNITEGQTQLQTPLRLPRALPRTSRLHQSHHTLLPGRRTAVQTLICKFENKLPSPNTPSEYTTATPPSISILTLNTNANTEMGGDRTPTTARFAAISNIFAPHSPSQPPVLARYATLTRRDSDNTSSTPTNAHNEDSAALMIRQYISSHALSRYNSSLASFRTCLLGSLTGVEELIDKAKEVQETREAEKLEQEKARLSNRACESGKSRVAVDTNATEDAGHRPVLATGGGSLAGVRLKSMWLLESPAPARDTHPTTTNLTSRRIRPVNPCDVTPPFSRQHKSFPIHETPSPNTESSTKPKFRDLLPSLRPTENPTKKSVRMNKLRARGFRVRKEDYGFKGDWWYEDLRRRGELELGSLKE